MTRLSLLDQVFFKLEQSGMQPVYMGGATIVDPADSPFPVDGKDIANHLAAVMEEIPLMRQKLVQDSMRLGDLRLVDDPDFDVNNHIVVTRLPAPGGYKELTEYLGKFSVRRLDLERPLWQYEVVEGLEGGRIAMAMHLHHSILDGVGAGRTLGGIFSQSPVQPRIPRRTNWAPDPEPGRLSLVGGALLENVRRLYVETPKFVATNTRPLLKILNTELAKRLRPLDENEKTSGPSLPKAQKTSLNSGRISDQRIVAYLELPLAAVKTLRKAHDCSINDLALFINSVALEHYFGAIGENIDFDLIAGMPLNARAEGDASVGNAVSMARVNLHNTIEDPKERLAAITRDTREIKASSSQARKDNKPGRPSIDFNALSSLFSPILLDTLFYGITRFSLLEKIPIQVNVGITNVPGPPGPQYIAGARVVSGVPMAPCGAPVALTITITSTGDMLIIGYHGCGEAIRDKELLVAGAHRAVELLQGKSAGRVNAKTKTKSKARTKPRPKTKARGRTKAGADTKKSQR